MKKSITKTLAMLFAITIAAVVGLPIVAIVAIGAISTIIGLIPGMLIILPILGLFTLLLHGIAWIVRTCKGNK